MSSRPLGDPDGRKLLEARAEAAEAGYRDAGEGLPPDPHLTTFVEAYPDVNFCKMLKAYRSGRRQFFEPLSF